MMPGGSSGLGEVAQHVGALPPDDHPADVHPAAESAPARRDQGAVADGVGELLGLGYAAALRGLQARVDTGAAGWP